MRPSWILPLVLLTPACISVPDPGPDDWLAAGFRTPEQTFHTFQTGFAGDRPSLEYRCLSAGFKRAISPDFTELAYREFRENLLREEPATRYLARAEVVGVEELGPDRVQLTARVKVLWIEALFEVELVREAFVRIQRGADVLVAEDLDSLADVLESNPDDGSLRAWLPPLAGIPVDEFSEVLMAVDWKIDALRTLSAP